MHITVDLGVEVECPKCRRKGRLVLVARDLELRICIVHEDRKCEIEQPDRELVKKVLEALSRLHERLLSLMNGLEEC